MMREAMEDSVERKGGGWTRGTSHPMPSKKKKKKARESF